MSENNNQVYIDRDAPQNTDITRIVENLKRGNVVLLPSDTCYGLSCIMFNKKAQDKIFMIKGRPATRTASIAVADANMFRLYGKTTPLMEKFISVYLPGPITIVTQATDRVPDYCVAPDGTIGLRIMSDELTGTIIKKLDTPIITTSANITGKPPAYNVEEFLAQIPNKLLPDLIVNAGKLLKKAPSTVISFSHDTIKILRAGSFVVPQEYIDNK